jgi:glycine/D-amino acid oxidase-like deaminating enzyme
VTEQFVRSMPLFLDAQRRWGSLETELGAPLGVHLEGGLMVAETPEQLGALRRKCAIENRAGLEARVLDGDEARSIAPYLSDSVHGAEWCPSEGHANPRLVGPAFAAAAAAHGATIRVRSPVVGLSRPDARWRVVVDGGEPVEAVALVIAAGVWSGDLAAMAEVPLRLEPHPLTIFATARTRALVPHLVQHAGRRLSLKQTAEGNVLVGGGWPARLLERDGRPDPCRRPALRLDSIAGSAATASEVVPALAPLPVVRIWSGIAAGTDDNVPVLGEVPGRTGLFIATAGSGFTLGPTFARLVAEQILAGRPSLPLDPFSPARFVAVSGR